MVSQNSSTADAVRVRNNQRRSRANHKEYVKSLELQLAEYKQRGVQATLDMQHAARSVALENQRLKAFVCSLGVSEEDLEKYLNSFEVSSRGGDTFQSGSVHKNKDSTTQMKRCNLKSRPVVEEPSRPDVVRLGVTAPTPGLLNTVDVALASEMRDASPHECSKGDTENNWDRENRGKGVCSPSTSTTDQPKKVMETSCEHAARIISQMRGHGEEDLVYSRLGCQDGIPKKCSVKNTVLFQIMDEV